MRIKGWVGRIACHQAWSSLLARIPLTSEWACTREEDWKIKPCSDSCELIFTVCRNIWRTLSEFTPLLLHNTWMDLPFSWADLFPSNNYIIKYTIELNRSQGIKSEEILSWSSVNQFLDQHLPVAKQYPNIHLFHFLYQAIRASSIHHAFRNHLRSVCYRCRRSAPWWKPGG